MVKIVFTLFLAAVATGCTTAPATKPDRQTYRLDVIRGKLDRLHFNMNRAQVKATLGAPSLIDDRSGALTVWYYLPDKPGGFILQYPDKLRVIFTGQMFSRYSFETTFASDYNWKF